MPEITGSSVAAVGGLTLFGVATGLDPVLIVAGLTGSFFSYYFMDPLPLARRISGAFFAALGSAWGAPVLVAALTSVSWWPAAVATGALSPLVALTIGFLTNPVIAPGSIQIARRKVEEAA